MLKAPTTEGFTEGGVARGYGGGASVIVVLSGPEEPAEVQKSVFQRKELGRAVLPWAHLSAI